jgi:hypothetical protein
MLKLMDMMIFQLIAKLNYLILNNHEKLIIDNKF